MADTPIVLASNRGPVSFRVGDDGEVVAHRGSGGLVAGLGALGERGDTTWIAAAFTDGDRKVAAGGPTSAAGFRLHLLDVPDEVWSDHYDVISNQTLWFLHHGLFDRPRTPVFDDRWRAAWASHRQVNEAFADAIAEVSPEGAIVLVQDYHLALAGAMVRERRPDLRTVHFHHTPFCAPDEAAILPDDVRAELLAGLAGFDACGFHIPAWADRFAAVMEAAGLAGPRRFVAALGVDADDLRTTAASAACTDAFARLDEQVGDRAFIARVDRIELSKNLLRGFDAYDLLLEREPAWRGRVVFGAFCYPSRENVPAYGRYRDDIVARVAAVNERWTDGDWTPILLETDDDFPRSLAAMRRNDVLVVNPIRDGLNLVAMEGALVNERHGGLVLSRDAGAWPALGAWSDGVHPFDVSETASALSAALARPAAERRELAEGRRAVAESRTAHDWLDDQLAAAGG
jgi:trehalose 6-phosphate synthase